MAPESAEKFAQEIVGLGILHEVMGEDADRSLDAVPSPVAEMAQDQRERVAFADEAAGAVPVDEVHMDMHLPEAGHWRGLRPVERTGARQLLLAPQRPNRAHGETAKPKRGQLRNEVLSDPVPGRHQDRKRAISEQAAQAVAAGSELVETLAQGPRAAELRFLLAAAGVIGVAPAMLEHGD